MASDPRPGEGTFLNGVAGPAAVERVHDAVAGAARACPSAADAMAFETAVMEVIGNLVEHAVGAAFTLEVRVGPESLEAVVEDDGEPPLLPPGGLDAIPVWAESGRGLGIARAALDELRLERRGDRNRWVMRREVRASST
ncbi:MAG: ATP-binding protein [Actinomycetales bacterium]